MKSILVTSTLLGFLLAAFALQPSPMAVATDDPAADVRVAKVNAKSISAKSLTIAPSDMEPPPTKTVHLDWPSFNLMRESGRSSEVLQLLVTRLATSGISATESAIITAEIGSIYLLDLHQSKEAVAWYERSALAAPDDRNVIHQLASLYESTSQEGVGIEFLTKIYTDNTSTGIAFELGRLQLHKGFYSAAVQSLELASYSDNDADTSYILGLALRGSGNQALACENLIQAMQALRDGSKSQYSSLTEKVVAQDLASCE